MNQRYPQSRHTPHGGSEKTDTRRKVPGRASAKGLRVGFFSNFKRSVKRPLHSLARHLEFQKTRAASSSTKGRTPHCPPHAALLLCSDRARLHSDRQDRDHGRAQRRGCRTAAAMRRRQGTKRPSAASGAPLPQGELAAGATRGGGDLYDGSSRRPAARVARAANPCGVRLHAHDR